MRYGFCFVPAALVGLLAAGSPAAKPSLKKELAALKVPPPWLDKVQVKWDVDKPWQDARLEVRRLLGEKGDKTSQGVKLTWLYHLKGDIGVPLAELAKPESEIFSTVYQGLDRLGMPAFGDTLGKEKIWKVITYISSRKGQK